MTEPEVDERPDEDVPGFQPWITEEGEYDLSEADYHRDPVVGGSLSSSGARRLLEVPPAKFRYEQLHGRLPKRAWDVGRAAHTKALSVGADIVVVTGTGKDPNAWRTAVDKAEVAKIRAAGGTPIRPNDAATVNAMTEALREHPIAGPLFARPGKAEQSFVARCPETRIKCRARTDWMPDVDDNERVLIVDYKTCESVSDAAFAKAMAEWGYDAQGPFYGDVLSWLGRTHGRAPQFVLVGQEKTPPYLVRVGWPDADAIGWGRTRNRKARDIYAQCVETGQWPGYPVDPLPLSLPGWKVAEYRAVEESGGYLTRADLAAIAAEGDQAA